MLCSCATTRRQLSVLDLLSATVQSGHSSQHARCPFGRNTKALIVHTVGHWASQLDRAESFAHMARAGRVDDMQRDLT